MDLVKSGSKYSDNERRQAVVEYCVHGVMSKVSECTDIPETTLATWKNKSDWWDDLVVEVRSEIGEQILAQNLTNAMKSGNELADRIENGDQKLLKVKRAIKHDDGSVEISEDYELRAEPMKGRDLAVVTGIVQDKARIQLNLPTSITQSSSGLDAMVKKFEAIADAYNERQERVVSVQEKSEQKSS